MLSEPSSSWVILLSAAFIITPVNFYALLNNHIKSPLIMDSSQLTEPTVATI